MTRKNIKIDKHGDYERLLETEQNRYNQLLGLYKQKLSKFNTEGNQFISDFLFAYKRVIMGVFKIEGLPKSLTTKDILSVLLDRGEGILVQSDRTKIYYFLPVSSASNRDLQSGEFKSGTADFPRNETAGFTEYGNTEILNKTYYYYKNYEQKSNCVPIQLNYYRLNLYQMFNSILKRVGDIWESLHTNLVNSTTAMVITSEMGAVESTYLNYLQFTNNFSPVKIITSSGDNIKNLALGKKTVKENVNYTNQSQSYWFDLDRSIGWLYKMGGVIPPMNRQKSSAEETDTQTTQELFELSMITQEMVDEIKKNFSKINTIFNLKLKITLNKELYDQLIDMFLVAKNNDQENNNNENEKEKENKENE